MSKICLSTGWLYWGEIRYVAINLSYLFTRWCNCELNPKSLFRITFEWFLCSFILNISLGCPVFMKMKWRPIFDPGFKLSHYPSLENWPNQKPRSKFGCHFFFIYSQNTQSKNDRQGHEHRLLNVIFCVKLPRPLLAVITITSISTLAFCGW